MPLARSVHDGLAGVAALTAAAIAAVGGVWPSALGDQGGPSAGLGAVVALALSGTLVVLAHGLWRGTRRAAIVAAAMLVAAAAFSLSDGQTVVGIAEIGALVAVAGAHRSFSRGARLGGARRPAFVAGAASVAAYATAVLALVVADQVTGVGAGIRAAGGWLVAGGWWMRSDAATSIALDFLTLAGLVSAGFAVRALMRPAASYDGHSAQGHARAAAIVAEHATDSLDPFALREDKTFHFAHDGLLAYRTLRGTAVVAGDPIGPPGTAGVILASFAAAAERRGWDVVLTGASDRHLADYRRLGFDAVCMGEEAVVDPADFTLDGGRSRSVRKAVNRQRRLGWDLATVAGSDLEPATIADIGALEDRWRAAQPRLTGFAMTLGRLWGAPEDDNCLYVLGRDPEGTLRAFVRFAEFRGGLSLDVMRRAGETPNGLTEALVATAIEHARDQGLRSVSLNFAGFGHLMAQDAPLTRVGSLARWVLGRAHGRFQLERLVTFNKKFTPRWERRYLVHQGAARLPVTALRVLQAERYVRQPRTRPLTARWVPAGAIVRRAPAPLPVP